MLAKNYFQSVTVAVLSLREGVAKIDVHQKAVDNLSVDKVQELEWMEKYGNDDLRKLGFSSVKNFLSDLKDTHPDGYRTLNKHWGNFIYVRDFHSKLSEKFNVKQDKGTDRYIGVVKLQIIKRFAKMVHEGESKHGHLSNAQVVRKVGTFVNQARQMSLDKLKEVLKTHEAEINGRPMIPRNELESLIASFQNPKDKSTKELLKKLDAILLKKK